MIPSSIHGDAVDAFVPMINRVGDPAVGFDLRKLVPSFLDYPADVVLDDGLLAALAWQYDVDVDGLEQGEAVAVIRGAIALHRRGGTPWAIKRALEIKGFEQVSIGERFFRDLFHDGSWVHDGSFTHGGSYNGWAEFFVSLGAYSEVGFNGTVVRREIDRRKSARGRLTSVSVLLRFAMRPSAPIYKVVFVCAGEEEFDELYVIDPYTLIFALGEEYDSRVVVGLRAYDRLDVVVGDVVFADPIIRAGCMVTIRLTLDLAVLARVAFDDGDSGFDDPLTNFDD